MSLHEPGWERRLFLLLAALGLVLGLVVAPLMLLADVRHSHRCEHAGGVWLDHRCIDRSALLKPDGRP